MNGAGHNCSPCCPPALADVGTGSDACCSLALCGKFPTEIVFWVMAVLAQEGVSCILVECGGREMQSHIAGNRELPCYATGDVILAFKRIRRAGRVRRLGCLISMV